MMPSGRRPVQALGQPVPNLGICTFGLTVGGTLKKCVNSQAVYPLSEQHGLEAEVPSKSV